MPSTVARPSRSFALVVVWFFALGLAVAACGGQNPYDAAQSAPPSVSSGEPGAVPTVTDTNDFLPEHANVSDCVGSAERGDCGSKTKGGWQMYLTFAALIGGLTFIGWRVVRGVRARDAARNSATTDAHARL
ncbi:MAG: hypothetical protein HY826_00305 [Actinobacteria bacterium]|nr:hypothetical protein [Actinomycetota bacterium]